jgi:hypothetical protein
MKKALNVILFLAIAVFTTACKLAVIVVEGGEVQSTAAGTCVAGLICIVDVRERNFSETFNAVPDEGWYFKEWNKGYRFFCQNYVVPTCELSFEGYENSEEVDTLLASSETFYLMPVFKPYQDIVIANGIEWLQPALFTNLSWNDVSAVCPDGECSGLLNGYDVTGWTWASVNEIRELFNNYIALDQTGRSPLGPAPDSYVEFSRSKSMAAFLSDGWRVTNENIGVMGLTRSLVDESMAYVASALYDIDTSGVCCSPLNDIFDIGRPQTLQEHNINTGAWLYRYR